MSKPLVIALIPARGDCLTRLVGQPLIVHTLRAAMESSCVQRTVVMTGDSLVADVAEKYGADVSRLLAPGRADDNGRSSHARLIDSIERDEGLEVDTVITLSPANPLRSGAEIDAAFECFMQPGADRLVSISPAWNHPQNCVTLDGEGRLDFYLPRKMVETNGRRQERAPVYVADGAIVIASRRVYRVPDRVATRGHVIDPVSAMTVTTPLDVYLAGRLIEWRRQGGVGP